MASNSGQGGNSPLNAVEQAHIFNAVGVNWTPANAPVGTRVTSVSMSVLVTDAANSVTDSDGTVTTNMPAGFSQTWQAANGATLNPPQIINPGPAGRILITFTVR